MGDHTVRNRKKMLREAYGVRVERGVRKSDTALRELSDNSGGILCI